MKKILPLAALVLLLAAGCSQTPQNNRDQSGQPQQNQEQNSQNTSTTTNQAMAKNSYTSPDKYGFSVEYPQGFGFNTDINKVRALSYIPACDETTVACVFYAGDKYKGTNFEAAGVSVNIDKSLNAESRCYNFKAPANEAQQDAGIVKINGVDFRSATGGQGAAGHFSKTQVYRNFRNGKCYELAQRVISTNIGNYEPGTVKEFNQDEVWQSLREIVNTFRFTAPAASNSAAQVAVTGTIACLPHKNVQPGQPQTLECAIGLQEEGTGKYYGLKDNPEPIYDTGGRLQVTGVLEKDALGKYDVVGNISVIRVVRLGK